jgi:hypothetical protein
MRLTLTLAAFVAGVFISLVIVEPLETKHVGLASVALGFATFVFTSQRSRNQERQQHTITILFQTRLSSEFRENLAKRKEIFSEGVQVSHKIYKSMLNARAGDEMSAEEARKCRECAEAIRFLLNYYEFIALGIVRRDLDEGMLRGSIRGIMCALVVDMANILKGAQADNPLAYRNLIWLFQRWRVHEPDPGFTVSQPSWWERQRMRIAQRIMP